MLRDDIIATISENRAGLERFGVKSVLLFGSIARNDARTDSDADILVEFDRVVGLFEFVDVKEYLEGLLKRRVDLVTPGALKPRMRETVLNEAIHAI